MDEAAVFFWEYGCLWIYKNPAAQIGIVGFRIYV